ncbi:DUF3566 domain-containing protein [Nocardioides sp.]|uniref:DUF3566 domain-containing protein n=1 Tax=Nocardioides sp. TaxID=35761 RepID=UPI002736CB25|nr:DUF3566 domain-containing protein [Nocardioides sp.]MDP3890742.1 DUF3566 domain-containing protein [Nocardioides sp.]
MADRRPPTPNGPPAQGPVRDAGDDTVVRPPLTARVAAALTQAADEHKANANPAPPPAEPATNTAKRGPRRARLRLSRIDPWSVMKTAFLLSVAFAIVTVVSVFIVWSVLGAAGVWESINATVQDVIGGDEAADFDVEAYVGMSRVLGFTMLVAVVDIVLITAIATLAAFLYNMAAALLGGIEVTLAEDEH